MRLRTPCYGLRPQNCRAAIHRAPWSIVTEPAEYTRSQRRGVGLRVATPKRVRDLRVSATSFLRHSGAPPGAGNTPLEVARLVVWSRYLGSRS